MRHYPTDNGRPFSKEVLVVLGIVAFVWLTFGAVAAVTIPEKKGGPQVAPSPPNRHLEWSEREVGGMILLNPYLPDSTGRARAAMIPPGSILLIPRWVDGPDPRPNEKT